MRWRQRRANNIQQTMKEFCLELFTLCFVLIENRAEKKIERTNQPPQTICKMLDIINTS